MAGGEPPKQDIFGGGQPQQGQTAPGAAPGGVATQTKTSTEGEIGSGGGAGAGQQAQSGEQVAPQQSAAQQGAAAVQRNVGRAKVPGFTQKIGSELTGQQSALEQESENYLKNAQSRSYGVAAPDIEKAVSGDKDAFGKIRGTLTRTADRAEEFKPTTPIGSADVENLGTESGLQALIRREAGPGRLSGAEAAFDARVLGGNTEFQNIRRQLLGQQESLRKRADEARQTQTAAAQKALEENLAKAQGDIRSQLGSTRSALRSDLEKRAAAENVSRETLRQDVAAGRIPVDLAMQIGAELEGLQVESPDEQRLDDLIGRAGKEIGTSPYVQVGANVTADDLINENEAQRFQSIMDLLGEGGAVAAGRGAGERLALNKADLRRDIMSRAGQLRASEDTRLMGERDAILAAAAAEAQRAAASDRLSPEEQQAAMMEALGGGVTPGTQAYDTAARINASQFYTPAGQATRESVLSAEQASKLNNILSQLGQKGEFKAGTAAKGKFDKAGYQAAINQAMQAILAQRAAAQSGAAPVLPTASGGGGNRDKPYEQQLADAAKNAPITGPVLGAVGGLGKGKKKGRLI